MITFSVPSFVNIYSEPLSTEKLREKEDTHSHRQEEPTFRTAGFSWQKKNIYTTKTKDISPSGIIGFIPAYFRYLI